MPSSNSLLLFSTLLLISAISAEICPPLESLSPCTCSETELSIQCVNIQGRFNIRAIFANASSFIGDDVLFEKLLISETSLIELPSGAVELLKFNDIQITGNRNLEYIYPDAFHATYGITRTLTLASNYLTNYAPYESDIFQFLNMFTALETLSLSGNKLTTVPEGAFSSSLSTLVELNIYGNRLQDIANNAFNPLQNLKVLNLGSNDNLTSLPEGGFSSLPSLETISLYSCSISGLGREVFSGSPNLRSVDFRYNSLTGEGMDVDALKGLGSSTAIDFRWNTGLDRLNQGIWKEALDNGTHISVGGTRCTSMGCSTTYLICDDEANWICEDVDHYKTVVEGFKCTGFGDVWGYCEQLVA